MDEVAEKKGLQKRKRDKGDAKKVEALEKGHIVPIQQNGKKKGTTSPKNECQQHKTESEKKPPWSDEKRSVEELQPEEDRVERKKEGSPTKKLKMTEQSEGQGVYLDGINILRAEQPEAR